ncbi:Ribosomal large subunit pseudouridine synthase A [Vibrio aerogenes CECT 7868]|uniref:Ribosomal large subunit pseudouridine synthase A n=1 Tax=Vibrio aerogenes CECT 7868 TaxID=1216006 RepID=A0A1M6DW32_9VIBR|nr:TIGR01621 family pseudouridine synthase [Vibrio aerogenes]SHI77339.1 Ribosomal large subunit pseudouridine synthase A [Vibrio aerogenes CECT 7868]
MFRIIHLHPDFVVINKYPGVSVHKDDQDVMLVQEVCKSVNEMQLYLVHRLDKMTSGLLLLARSPEAARLLSDAFAQRQVEKYYLAIGTKKPKKKQGLVCGDMVRSRRSAWKLTSGKENPAVTQFFSAAGENGQRVFLCRPRTGKTHQIRVALKSVGSPILGDAIYNPASDADRGYLHAFALRFDYQEAAFSFVCDPREYDFTGSQWHQTTVSNAIDQWLSPWSLSWPER